MILDEEIPVAALGHAWGDWRVEYKGTCVARAFDSQDIFGPDQGVYDRYDLKSIGEVPLMAVRYELYEGAEGNIDAVGVFEPDADHWRIDWQAMNRSGKKSPLERRLRIQS